MHRWTETAQPARAGDAAAPTGWASCVELRLPVFAGGRCHVRLVHDGNRRSGRSPLRASDNTRGHRPYVDQDAFRSTGFGVQPDEETPFVFGLYRTDETEERNNRPCAEVLQRLKTFAAKGNASVQLVYLPLTLEMNFDAIQSGAHKRGMAVDV